MVVLKPPNNDLHCVNCPTNLPNLNNLFLDGFSTLKMFDKISKKLY